MLKTGRLVMSRFSVFRRRSRRLPTGLLQCDAVVLLQLQRVTGTPVYSGVTLV